MAAGAAVLGAGCATPPPTPIAAPAPPPAPPAPKVTTLEQYLQEGKDAFAAGSTAKALESYQAAARAYPSNKEPWARQAELYFESADYGNAIVAAEEVIQRDAGDEAAAGILAVSGLRVATKSLDGLRVRNGIAGTTREQAAALARTLRDILGERELVPGPASNAAATPPAAAPARPPQRARLPAARPATAAASAPTAPAAAPPPPPKPSSPLDRLK